MKRIIFIRASINNSAWLPAYNSVYHSISYDLHFVYTSIWVVVRTNVLFRELKNNDFSS